jgi:hypothetical protein
VPGCKTDVNDATRLAEPLAHGLLRVSFVPDLQTQEMRTLLRSRKQLVREQSSHVLCKRRSRTATSNWVRTNPVKLDSLAHRRV